MAGQTGSLRACRNSRPRLHRARHPANASRFSLRRPLRLSHTVGATSFKDDLLTPHISAGWYAPGKLRWQPSSIKEPVPDIRFSKTGGQTFTSVGPATIDRKSTRL